MRYRVKPGYGDKKMVGMVGYLVEIWSETRTGAPIEKRMELEFPGWNNGHRGTRGNGLRNRWYFYPDNNELESESELIAEMLTRYEN